MFKLNYFNFKIFASDRAITQFIFIFYFVQYRISVMGKAVTIVTGLRGVKRVK